MANLYGPMQYKPNPSGMTLNSRPQWTPPPAPAAAPAPSIMSFEDWRAQDGNSWKDYYRRRITGDRGSRSDGAPAGMAIGRQRSAYDQYRLDALSGQLSPGGILSSAPASGMTNGFGPYPLQLDAGAASYTNFLNGR